MLLTSKKDPSNKITNDTYDANGNLTKAVYDPTGANQTTLYTYDGSNRLTGVTEPNGTTVTLTYDADGNRTQKTLNGTTISDVYALGHLDHQTDGSGNILATFTYDATGEPTSVVVGNPTSGTRYSYVYNGHGDVVALVDTSGNVKASYSYDAFGALTSSSETLANGWSNPYRYDGAEGVRYDPETGLYWMRVRAYDPTLGRFISHDPLGRLAAMGVDTQPYGYAGNNPVNQTDPTGLLPCGAVVDGHCRSYWHEHPNAADIDGCKTGVGPYVQFITGALVFLRNGFYAARALLGSFWTYWAGVAAVDALEGPALTVVGSVMEVLTPFLGEIGNAGWAMIGIAQMALANWKKESAEELSHWCAGDGGCGPEPTRYIYVVY